MDPDRLCRFRGPHFFREGAKVLRLGTVVEVRDALAAERSEGNGSQGAKECSEARGEKEEKSEGLSPRAEVVLGARNLHDIEG